MINLLDFISSVKNVSQTKFSSPIKNLVIFIRRIILAVLLSLKRCFEGKKLSVKFFINTSIFVYYFNAFLSSTKLRLCEVFFFFALFYIIKILLPYLNFKRHHSSFKSTNWKSVMKSFVLSLIQFFGQNKGPFWIDI